MGLPVLLTKHLADDVLKECRGGGIGGLGDEGEEEMERGRRDSYDSISMELS